MNTTYIAGRILDIVGDNVKPPKNDACPALAKTAGVPKELTLIPSGQVTVKKGSHTDITVAGAQRPYIMPLFSTLDVTGTLKDNNVFEVAATQDADDGEYPFFVGDGPNGRPIRVIINETAKCPSTADGKKAKEKRPINPKNVGGEPGG